MTVEVALLLSGLSVSAALYFGVRNAKRNDEKDLKEETAQVTTVIVKLETLLTLMTETKEELGGVKEDVKEYIERLIRCEESVKQVSKRLDVCERNYGREQHGRVQ